MAICGFLSVGERKISGQTGGVTVSEPASTQAVPTWGRGSSP